MTSNLADLRVIEAVYEAAGAPEKWPTESRPTDPALIRDLFDLTLGEARVASLIGAGQSPRETVHNLNIAEETARTVLIRVFSKTGASRQSELAAMCARLSIRPEV